jgi:xanthine dehydrogenase accessory factor
MQEIFKEIVYLKNTGGSAALATVISVKGSTPRAEGSRMLIRADGSIIGSIGGGCVEASVWQAAKKTIDTQAAQILDYDLTGRSDTPEGLICGGKMQVFIEPLQASGEVFTELLRRTIEGEVCSLATVISSLILQPEPGRRLLLTEDGSLLGSLDDGGFDTAVREAGREVLEKRKPALISCGAVKVFVEPVFPEPALYIFGAGHIGFALSKIARLTGFKVVVIDDRPAYANKDRFPDAEEFYVEDPAEAVSHFKFNKTSYIVIACRGHLEDQRVLAEVLKTPAGYIGMIGSRKKAKTVFVNLTNQGVAAEAFKRIHSPIGLPIATETPEEIAVSIMAEIIDARHMGKKVNRETSAV